MKAMYSPMFLSKVLKSYLCDLNRLSKFNDVRLRKFQDTCFRKILSYSNSVPVYHEIYKKKEVNVKDIVGIADINYLPIISKDDLKKGYPEGIISTKLNRNSLIEVSTSGTTGKSLSIFVDMFDVVTGLFGYLRAIREHGINWRKHRITIIGDFASHTAETGYVKRGIQSWLGNRYLFKNMQWLDTNDEPEKIMKDLCRFKPDFIGGYVGMIGHLALLNEKEEFCDVKPKCIGLSGAVLHKPMRKFIEDSFDTKVFEAYGATESGPIAFECSSGHYHVFSDLVHLEFFRDGKPDFSEKPGNVVVTKLYGRGTPIIRYNAINDIVSPATNSCDCGLSGDCIDRIYGRDDLALYLPGGKVFLASSFNEIFSRVIYELKSQKIKNVSIVQPSFKKVEVGIVIDNKYRDVGSSVNDVFSLIETGFKEKIGSDVDFVIKEIDKVDEKKPRIISKVDSSKFKISEYV